jgi:hypothetical protein
MATTRLGIVAICSLLITAASCKVQDRAPAPPPAPPRAPAPLANSNTDLNLSDVTDIADIVDIIGSDADARAVIAQILAAVSHQRRGTVVLASQIRPEWLPVMSGVDIVRLSDSEIRPFLAGCGRYWIITNVERTENDVRLTLEMKCSCTSSYYTASFDGNLWRVQSNGQGCGCGGPQPADCPCFGR